MKDYQSTDRKPRWGPEISVGDSPRSAPRLLLVTFREFEVCRGGQ